MTARLPCLRQELNLVSARATEKMAGVGLIVHDGSTPLPTFPMRSAVPPLSYLPLSSYLLELCDESSEFHDGFQVLDGELRLLVAAQYFSPPISREVVVDSNRRFGGRYMAALFGSLLPGVLTTAVVSRTYGVKVFELGKEI